MAEVFFFFWLASKSFFAFRWTQTLRRWQISDCCIKARFQCWFPTLLNFEKVSHLNDSVLNPWMRNQVVAFISTGGSSYIVVDVYVMPHIINWGALHCCKKHLKVFSALLMRVVVNCRFAIQQTPTIITQCVLFISSQETRLLTSVARCIDEKFSQATMLNALMKQLIASEKFFLFDFWKQSRMNYLLRIWTETLVANYLRFHGTWKQNFENQ